MDGEQQGREVGGLGPAPEHAVSGSIARASFTQITTRVCVVPATHGVGHIGGFQAPVYQNVAPASGVTMLAGCSLRLARRHVPFAPSDCTVA